MRRGTVGPVTQIGAGSFTSGGVTLQHYLPWVVITNADTVLHTFTFQLLTITQPPLTLTVNIASGETESYPVAPFQSIKIDTATSNAVYFYSPDAISSVATVQTSTLSNGGATLPQQVLPITLSATTFQVQANPPTNTRWIITGLQVVLVLDAASTATVTAIQIGQQVAGAGSLVYKEYWTKTSLNDSLTANQSEALNLVQVGASGQAGATIEYTIAALAFPLEVNYNTIELAQVTLSAGSGTGKLYLTGFGYQEPL